MALCVGLLLGIRSLSKVVFCPFDLKTFFTDEGQHKDDKGPGKSLGGPNNRFPKSRDLGYIHNTFP